MLSDVEIPLFDPEGTDPAVDYEGALDLLAGLCRQGITTVIPGHGSVATGDEIGGRIAADQAYVRALRAGTEPDDPRVGPAASYGRDWLPAAHEHDVALPRADHAGRRSLSSARSPAAAGLSAAPAR